MGCVVGVVELLGVDVVPRSLTAQVGVIPRVMAMDAGGIPASPCAMGTAQHFHGWRQIGDRWTQIFAKRRFGRRDKTKLDNGGRYALLWNRERGMLSGVRGESVRGDGFVAESANRNLEAYVNYITENP